MVPKGKTFANAPALIYVQVFYHADKQQSLANFAGVSNGRWRAAVKDAKVSELPTIGRANGKPGFLRFAFENPSKTQQAYEVGAFGIDSDKDGNEFVLDVVMTGAEQGGTRSRREGLYRLPENALIQCAVGDDDHRKLHYSDDMLDQPRLDPELLNRFAAIVGAEIRDHRRAGAGSLFGRDARPLSRPHAGGAAAGIGGGSLTHPQARQ